LPDKPGALGGILVPVTTPFDRVTGEIAPVVFRESLRRWLKHPLDGVVLFGSTGEGALLDEDEKERLLGFARDVVPEGIAVVAGIGAESTRSAIRQARLAADQAADAVLVHPPSYFGVSLSPAALRDHFTAIADASPIPVVLYHIPKYTHVTLEPGLISELTRHPNVVGVKDSSGDLKRLADYSLACHASCRLLVGNGSMLYTAFELGAAGGIVAVGLLAPAWCVAMRDHFRAGEGPRAGQLQGRIARLHKEIVAHFGVPGVRAALELLDLPQGPPRPPLRPLSDRDRAQVARVMQEVGLV
jgi:4-hydroxy-2-oxoglutarate aldolase